MALSCRQFPEGSFRYSLDPTHNLIPQTHCMIIHEDGYFKPVARISIFNRNPLNLRNN